jgi:Spy/CpxP family protein refolding chaperone
MPPELSDPALDYLLASAGLDLTDAQKQDLKTIHQHLSAMKDRVRQPRGRMAELAHAFRFTAEDLS